MRLCSAAAPRTRCGTTASATPRYSPFSPTISRAPPRAATCWRARCSPRATAKAPRRWCATPGATKNAAPTSRTKCSRCTAACLRAPTTRCAWSSASMPTTSKPACAPPPGSAAASARQDPGYIFSRVQWLRKDNKPEEAGQLILTVPQDPAALVDLDQWWLERRILVRKLLDDNDPQTAYRVARDAAPPPRGFHRVDAFFTAGWIALRFLHDPKTAAAHFAHIVENTVSPYALSRGGYWQGRTAEAMGQRAQAKAYYETAAQYTATYYGQIARARLGLTDLGLRGPPSVPPAAQAEIG